MAELSDLPTFLYSQLWYKPALPTTRLDGKTVCVTGANVGLGKEAVRHFVRLGASKVILACRNASAGEDAKRDIEASEESQGVVQVWNLDLLDYANVKAFANRLNDLERLDIVVLNAGMSLFKPLISRVMKYRHFNSGMATEDFILDKNGNERSITTNVISTFLLALLLLPNMSRRAITHSTLPTLTIVSSEVHAWTNLTERAYLPSNPANATSKTPLFDALSDKQKADMTQRYQTSKLLEILALRSLTAEQPVSKIHVVVNTVNPGLCHSSLGRDATGGRAYAMWLMLTLLARKTDVGSRTLVHAGLSGEDTHGQFMYDCAITTPGPMVTGKAVGEKGKYVQGAELQQIVWDELKVKLEEIEPGVTRL